MSMNTISLCGKWCVDYISNEQFKGETMPEFFVEEGGYSESVTVVDVPGYWEDMLDRFRSTTLHTKLTWNPLYTRQTYPQAGYPPDMALPNPVGSFLYKRNFTLDEDVSVYEGIELYVGGVQNALTAWINGTYIGRHEGYSCEFFMQVPQSVLVKGENNITLVVSNNRLAGYKGRPISGLTTRASNTCTGGIWGEIGLRFYPDGIRDAWVSTAKDMSTFTVKVDGGVGVEKTVSIYEKGKLVDQKTIKAGDTEATFSCEGYRFWTPATPNLYDAVICSARSEITTRFGIRRLTSDEHRLYLNGKPYFFRGTCEHCYHPLTVHPTRDKSYYRRVLSTLKGLGFNSIRFHTYIPMPEYMEAADELGMVMEVETPNNTTYSEWQDIVKACRHHASVCGYSSGNEMPIDEAYIEHLNVCADFVHSESDSLFSPMSAMSGVEYVSYGDHRVDVPFPHNPTRLAALDAFCDMYNTYSLGATSYTSNDGKAAELDVHNSIYHRPLLSHEICIHGTYIDLSLMDRYQGSRIGETEFMSSVKRHLADMGLLDKANLYYRNSSAWQATLRKYCFETVRRTHSFAGYDFLGDIDTHWHTFGYCVGMMNEFYELKPYETARNVLSYNSDTVLLADLPETRSFYEGQAVSIPLHVSQYGDAIAKATLNVRVACGDEVILRREIRLSNIENGKVSELYTLRFVMPKVETPRFVTICVSLSGGNTDAENQWELYLFPKMKERRLTVKELKHANLTVAEGLDVDTLLEKMKRGERVVIFGTEPFASVKTDFQISLAGRTMGHLATVVADHPILNEFPHRNFCSWQFKNMINGGHAVIVDNDVLPHDPIMDIASAYKNAHREALMFEYRVGNGRLLVCSLNLEEKEPAVAYLKERILAYALSDQFEPKQQLSLYELEKMCRITPPYVGVNVNEAQNKNDITMVES